MSEEWSDASSAGLPIFSRPRGLTLMECKKRSDGLWRVVVDGLHRTTRDTLEEAQKAAESEADKDEQVRTRLREEWAA